MEEELVNLKTKQKKLSNQRVERKTQDKRSLTNLGDYIKVSNIHMIGIPKRGQLRQRKKEFERHPKFYEKYQLTNLEDQWTSSRINVKRTISQSNF